MEEKKQTVKLIYVTGKVHKDFFELFEDLREKATEEQKQKLQYTDLTEDIDWNEEEEECKHEEGEGHKEEEGRGGSFYERFYCVKCGVLMRTKYFDFANNYNEITGEEEPTGKKEEAEEEEEVELKTFSVRVSVRAYNESDLVERLDDPTENPIESYIDQSFEELEEGGI